MDQEHVHLKRFDVSHTMDRLRDGLVGQTSREERMANVQDFGSFMDRDCEGSEVYPENGLNYQTYLDLQDTNSSDDWDGKKKTNINDNIKDSFLNILHQIPAVALIAMFHLMIGIPFGVSYFPVNWREASTVDPLQGTEDGIHGSFPVAGKDALGIRMFLFSTIIGQITFSFTSGFVNPISIQMIENVPFCQVLAHIVIAREGYGMKSLSTLMFMFGLSTVFVGIVFFILGKMELGRIVYFFPTHVLVGCIAGIGLFIVKTSIEVTIDKPLSLDSLVSSMNLFSVVIFFEIFLRILERLNVKDGKPRFALLSPIYFCMITPAFYLLLRLTNWSVDDADNAGFFFPQLDAEDEGTSHSGVFDFDNIFSGDLLNMWRLADLNNISWPAVVDSIPTLIALSLFSLIHVPINIPAFAISTNQEADMNLELRAHGYSNICAGLCGGLQNYMAYTQSVLYARSGGTGRPSGIAVAFVTSILFLVGPTIASFIPRCMAGTLLLHVGIDLFLEGVWDTLGKFERLEYAGTWLITIIMTTYGMSAAMIAGGISAVSTYAVQTVAYLHPIRGHMTAVTFRSSKRNRNHQCNIVLDDPDFGRSRILVVQLQGHLFFGNMAQLNKSIDAILSEKRNTSVEPLVVIMDFSLVLGIDSSAAQAISKMKKMMRRKFQIQLCVFATGSRDGFPCDYDLSSELVNEMSSSLLDESKKIQHSTSYINFFNEETALLAKGQIPACKLGHYHGSHVSQSLDTALIIAENALIYKQDPSLLEIDINITEDEDLPVEKEREVGLKYLCDICPGEAHIEDIEILFSKFERQVYRKGEMLWLQASPSDCAMLLVRGELVANLENEAGTREIVQVGRMVGELGLVEGSARMSSVRCLSDEVVTYRLGREAFEELTENNPSSARLVDLICITYLAHRVQHVSNRIFETQCLPI
jgi:SulP family sulfate permease